MTPSPLLLASTDDYLLEEALHSAIADACRGLAVDAPEHLAAGISASDLALELDSPSLFSPRRVLVVASAGHLLTAPPPAGGRSEARAGDLEPLLRALEGGLSEDLALILAAWCGGKPSGPLVDAVERHGRSTWISIPPPPKPWEEGNLSEEQVALLRGVLRRAAPEARFTPAAESLLTERLGFAPRALATEAHKLAAAAGSAEIDEELVRRLALPRERSLEALRDAVFARDLAVLHDLLEAAAAGVPITDWRGQRMDPDWVPSSLLGQIAAALEQVLELKLLAAELGLADRTAPERTASRSFYRSFQNEVVPQLDSALAATSASALRKGGRLQSPWFLSRVFAAAGRYRLEELTAALAAAGEVERRLRGALPLEAVSAWLAQLASDRRRGHARP